MAKQRSPGENVPTLPGLGIDEPGVAIPIGELQHAIDRFDRYYRDAYGTRPTWGAKQGAMLKRLLSAHGLDEVLARMERLFRGIDWPKPPYDLGVLVAQFDRLVGDIKPRKLSPSEIASGAWRKR
jgi:hypothetical protein